MVIQKMRLNVFLLLGGKSEELSHLNTMFANLLLNTAMVKFLHLTSAMAHLKSPLLLSIYIVELFNLALNWEKYILSGII